MAETSPRIRFVTPVFCPTHICAHWILPPDDDGRHGGLIFGDPADGVEWIPKIFLNRMVIYLKLKDDLPEIELASIAWDIDDLVINNSLVYITGPQSIYVVGRFIKRWFAIDSNEELMKLFTKIISTRASDENKNRRRLMRDALVQIGDRPMKVLVCGDRNAGNRFESIMNKEFRTLPKYSLILHGGCKGVDQSAGRVAHSLEFIVNDHPAQWDTHGLAAGPIRNGIMISREPDLVIAFHSDIKSSKGTKNMISQASRYTSPITGNKPHIYINGGKNPSVPPGKNPSASIRPHFDETPAGVYQLDQLSRWVKIDWK